MTGKRGEDRQVDVPIERALPLSPVYLLKVTEHQSPPLGLLFLWKAFGFGLGCAVTTLWHNREVWVPKLQILLGP
jgi:hypothetical protein